MNSEKKMNKKEKFENYEKFVEKFKPKKTTDDCYTPPEVYNVVKEWVVNEYNLQDLKIVRPFYPGGDFENFDYPKNCVVIDNPPFSILKKIKDFYIKNNIKFFLFAPGLTLFGGKNEDGICYIVTGVTVEYANNAKVSTSFVTNLDKDKIRLVPTLASRIKKIAHPEKKIKKYKYPKNVISAARLFKYINWGIEIRFKGSEVYPVKNLKKDDGNKVSIYGGGFIISDKKAQYLHSFHGKRTEYVDLFLSDEQRKKLDELNENEKKER